MPKRFSSIQIFIHWLAFLLVVATFVTINIKDFFPKSMPAHDFIKLVHFNLGVLVFVITFIRIIIYHIMPVPRIEPPSPLWQMQAAKLMHLLLYLAFILLPITGILMLAYAGKQWCFFGFEVPTFVQANPDLKKVFKSIHEMVANIAYLLIALHALAALYHHYIQKDNALLRMMPNKK